MTNIACSSCAADCAAWQVRLLPVSPYHVIIIYLVNNKNVIHQLTLICQLVSTSECSTSHLFESSTGMQSATRQQKCTYLSLSRILWLLTGELVLVSTPCSKPSSEMKPGILLSNCCSADLRAWLTSGEYKSCRAALFTPSLHTCTNNMNSQASMNEEALGQMQILL